MRAIVVCITFFLGVAVSSWAGTWSDNFNDGDLDGWQTFEENRGLEKWTVENGEASAKSFGTFAILYTGEADWKDYTVECKANPKSLGRLGLNTMGIWVRLQEHDGYYMAMWMSPAGDARYAIFKKFTVIKSVDLANLGKLPMPGLNKWYKLKAKVEGNKLSFYVNDMLALEVKDDTIKSGKVGLCVQGTSVHAHFDEVKITGADIPNKGPLSVHSKFRLATSWGKIKFSY